MDVVGRDEQQHSRCRTIFWKQPLWWSYGCSDVRLLLVSLLLLCTIATTLQFLHHGDYPITSSSCLLSSSSSSSTSPVSLSAPTTHHHHQKNTTQEETVIPLSSSSSSSSAVVTKRSFTAVGSAAYLFIKMSAYRISTNSFAVIGLSSKPLHVYGHPNFTCRWTPHSPPSSSTTVAATKILPDWGFGRIYTVVVLLCSFNSTGSDGGRLVVDASTAETTETIEALVESPGIVDVDTRIPKYEILYCGSPLYGELSPQRLREWLAYHVRVLGGRRRRRSIHLVMYDAGGVQPAVAEVLAPWMEKGYVSLQDIREQEMFDGYYHNQFLVVNDCLHRYRFDAKWIFFFDVDEFIYVSPKTTLQALLSNMEGVAQFTFQQRPMSSSLCLTQDLGRKHRMWGMEKFVYRDVKRGIRRDRKYAIQPRKALATGVHMSQNVVGKKSSLLLHRVDDDSITYFHYHGSINQRHETCKRFVDASNLTYNSDGTPYVLDTTLRLQAPSIKAFELQVIGPRLQNATTLQ